MDWFYSVSFHVLDASLSSKIDSKLEIITICDVFLLHGIKYFILSVTTSAIKSRHDQSAFDSRYILENYLCPTLIWTIWATWYVSYLLKSSSFSLFYVALSKYAFWNILLFKNIILVWYASRVQFVWHGKYPYRIGSWCIKFRTRSEFWISDWSGLWLVNWKSSKALAE